MQKKQNKPKIKANNDIAKPITSKPKTVNKPQGSVVKKQPKKNKSKGAVADNVSDNMPGRFVRMNPSSPMANKKQKPEKTKPATNGNSQPYKKGKFSEKPTDVNGAQPKKAKKRPSPNVLAGSKKAQAAIKRLKPSQESNDDDDDEELAKDVLAFRNNLMGKLEQAGRSAVAFSDSEAESIDLADEAPPSKKPKFVKPVKEALLPVKEANVDRAAKQKPEDAISEEEEGIEEADAPSSFRDKLIGNLKGSRFRFLNEKLYSTEGSGGMKLFKEDKGAFKAYHEGYRQQVQQWPLNPLDRIIKSIKKL